MSYEINLELVRKKREKLGFTNAFMAESLGLKTPDKYFRREAGSYKFQSLEIPALAKVLDIPIEKIFKIKNAKIAQK